MNWTVKLFGPLAQAARRSEVTVPYDGPARTVADLRKRLAQTEPALAAMLGASRIAVNHEFAQDDRAIRPGDEIAVIGMVSGG